MRQTGSTFIASRRQGDTTAQAARRLDAFDGDRAIDAVRRDVRGDALLCQSQGDRNPFGRTQPGQPLRSGLGSGSRDSAAHDGQYKWRPTEARRKRRRLRGLPLVAHAALGFTIRDQTTGAMTSPFGTAGGLTLELAPIGKETDFVAFPEIYLVSYPQRTTRVQVSTAGGVIPRWRRDGKELFFTAGRSGSLTMMAVDVDLSRPDTPRVGLPQKLFEMPALNSWDVAADGQRFLMILEDATDSADMTQPVRVMVNWWR
jgi:hypothetical protein